MVTPVNYKVNTKSYSNWLIARIDNNLFSCHSKICHVILISLKDFRKSFYFQRTLFLKDQNILTKRCQIFKVKMIVHALKFSWSIFYFQSFAFQPLSYLVDLMSFVFIKKPKKLEAGFSINKINSVVDFGKILFFSNTINELFCSFIISFE